LAPLNVAGGAIFSGGLVGTGAFGSECEAVGGGTAGEGGGAGARGLGCCCAKPALGLAIPIAKAVSASRC
jgi:hypothetical protein